MRVTTTEQMRRAFAAAGNAKVLARDAGVHPVTAMRWQRGDTEPCASVLLRLMARRRDLAAALLRAAGLDDHSLAAERAHLDAHLAAMLARRAALHDAPHTPMPPLDDVACAALAGALDLRDATRAPHPLRRATDRAVGVSDADPT